MQYKNNLSTTGIYARSRSGFTLVEFVVGVALLGMLILAVYLYQKDQDAIDNQTQDNQEIYQPLPTDSSDDGLNQSADELNQLSTELDSLDDIEDDLTLPDIDFSE